MLRNLLLSLIFALLVAANRVEARNRRILEVTTGIPAPSEYLKKYEDFMHAYVDDLSMRMVKMNFAALKGEKDPWTTNFKDFLSDKSLHKLLKSGPAPPWIASQKVQLDLWRKADKETPIQELLIKEFSNEEIKSILLNSEDPLLKTIFNSKTKEQFASWSKVAAQWMKKSEQAGKMLQMFLDASNDTEE